MTEPNSSPPPDGESRSSNRGSSPTAAVGGVPFESPSPAPWSHLRRHTDARIALGRSGGSLPTRELLAFNLDHALARDAVHAPFDAEALATELRAIPNLPEICVLESAAPDRTTYLQRPELGRCLSDASAVKLASRRAASAAFAPEAVASLALIVSDGLSALAAQRQAPALLRELLPALRAAGFALAPLCVVRHARVGLLDEIGSALRTDFALILLGERPGLGTPDSLSAYFTFGPAPQHTDADRNCVSNIRAAGLPPREAAAKLTAWLLESLRQHHSGVSLKEPVIAATLPPAKS